MLSLERLVEADGGGAVEDHVDAAAERLDVLGADGQAGLHQLAADGDDLPVEVRVVLPHAVEKLRKQTQTRERGRSGAGGSAAGWLQTDVGDVGGYKRTSANESGACRRHALSLPPRETSGVFRSGKA